MSKDNCIFVSIYIGVGVVLFAFWMSVVGIYDNGQKEKYQAGPMPNYPQNITYFELKKDLGFAALLWRWQYTSEIADSEFVAKQACYSLNHDVLVSVNGNLLFRSDGKILTTTSDVYIYDNEGNKKYKITTGDFWITLLNQNKIRVNFHMEDASGNTVLYAEKTDIFQLAKSFTFKDTDGVTVSTATKDITNFPWTWKVNLYLDRTSVHIDYPALMTVFAHSSFAEKGTDDKGKPVDKTDSCNQYFFVVSILDGILTFLYICFTVWMFWELFKGCYEKTKTWCIDTCSFNGQKSSVEIHPYRNETLV
ncbi:hypothetical protein YASMINEVIRUS_623 [Yasminevirus sp. GU-2018]|uniref:Uncharacterized protein n=1 Tax=Yasminevirus sp. GU-2018 TaxID=2420051 RepID=A0A5K0U8N1_9VIRU|nr:hypothetical protein YASMINEVIRUS_623 [Yasminevirus sp. GU-2018]